MAYCGEHCLVKYGADARRAVTAFCHSWTCPNCQDGRRRRLIWEANDGKPNTFLTLTIRRSLCKDAEDAALTLSWAWRLVRLRAIREAKRNVAKRPQPSGPVPARGWPRNAKGQTVPQVKLWNGTLDFLAVIEPHESGWPHLHIMARSYWIDFYWLQAQFIELLDSHHVRVERIFDRSRASGYVAKYCTDCSRKFGTAKRYWQSRSYKLSPKPPKPPKDPPGEGWERQRHNINHFITIWTQLGWLVEQPNTWSAIARAPPPEKAPPLCT